MAEDTRDRLIRYIQDAHAAEVGIIQVLEGFLNEVHNDTARSALQQHLEVTRSQAQRLETRLNALGGKTSTAKEFMNRAMGWFADLHNAGHDSFDKTTTDLIQAYATEHMEIGMYTALIAYAQAINDQETVALAQQILSEEKQAAETIFPMISQAAVAVLGGIREPVAV